MKIVALGGDGAGPEVLREALKSLQVVQDWSGLPFEIEDIPCGGRYYLENGRDWPEGSEDKCREADAILLGAVGWPSPTGPGPVMMKDGRMAGWSPVIGNRIGLELYANVRPVKLYPGVQHRIHGKSQLVWQPGLVDMVIIRENTEDLYCDIGGVLAPAGQTRVAIDTRIITAEASERVIRHAFELSGTRFRGAPQDGKKRVTAIVKDNVLRGCKLFVEVFRRVAAEYPDIEAETSIVDSFTQALLLQPEHYDVCVTTNLFGDIVTDLASVLQGGMGMAVGCNLGEHHAMFEPIHGSAPIYAGKNKLNPLAMILALGECLHWLSRRKAAQSLAVAAVQVEATVKEILLRGHPLTFDLVGDEKAASTSEVGDAVAALLHEKLIAVRA